MASKWLTEKVLISAHTNPVFGDFRSFGFNCFYTEADEDHGRSVNFGINIDYWFGQCIIQCEVLRG
jgi:hypothetical protein